MPRINWNAVEREEAAIEKAYADGEITIQEYHKQINALHRDVREEYEEQQRDEMRDEFGW